MKANLKRRLEAIQQAAESKRANQPTENPYSDWSTEQLQAEIDRFLAEPRPQPWDNMSLEELKYYYAEMMRDRT